MDNYHKCKYMCTIYIIQNKLPKFTNLIVSLTYLYIYTYIILLILHTYIIIIAHCPGHWRPIPCPGAYGVPTLGHRCQIDVVRGPWHHGTMTARAQEMTRWKPGGIQWICWKILQETMGSYPKCRHIEVSSKISNHPILSSTGNLGNVMAFQR